VSILYRMPYIGLEEPIRAAVDEPAGLQRLDFYDGLNTFIFNASGLRTETGVKETAIEILPVVDHKDCFAHPTVTSPHMKGGRVSAHIQKAAGRVVHVGRKHARLLHE
jgi:hypothetical protein